MYKWSDKVVQFVKDTIDDLDEEMPLLVLQGRGHQQGKDLVEQSISSKLTSFVSDLTEGRLHTTKTHSM